MRHFGPQDPDTRPLMHLLSLCSPIYVLHYAKTPINARPCQQPGSLKVQGVMVDGKMITVTQHADHLQVERNYTE